MIVGLQWSKKGGVNKLIRDKYPKTLLFYWANEISYIVINDLNKTKIIRSTNETIMRLFRENTFRRILLLNVPLLCEKR